MSKDPLLYAIHILESIEKINLYLAEDSSLFFNDAKTYDAVIRNLQTLSEATSHLEDKFKEATPDLEWSKIYGFRNILVHDYLGSLDPKMNIMNILPIQGGPIEKHEMLPGAIPASMLECKKKLLRPYQS